MRVLHIDAAGSHAGADARATAEVLLAMMVSQDPGLLLDELVLATTAPAAVTRDRGAHDRVGLVQRADPQEDAQVAVVERILAADVIVLSVDGAAPSGHPDRVDWMLAALSRPDALRARAEMRRSGRRVSRRLVLVAPPLGDGHEAHDLAELVLCVRWGFRSADVAEFGVIAGGTAGDGALPAVMSTHRAAARWWARSRMPDRRAS